MTKVAIKVLSNEYNTSVGHHNDILAFSNIEMKNRVRNSNDEKWPDKPKVFPELVTPAVLPDGNGGFTPCPELLTEDEAIRYLRLDVDSSSNPERTLK